MNRIILMNKVLVAAGIVCVVAVAQDAWAQKIGGSPFTRGPKDRGPIVGGYEKVSVTDKEVVAAAKFAVKARQDAIKAEGRDDKVVLVKIVSAASQVVAGFNYELKLAVKEGNEAGTVKAVVYSDISSNLRLTSWDAVEAKDGRDSKKDSRGKLGGAPATGLSAPGK